jgi:hypothetical protein
MKANRNAVVEVLEGYTEGCPDGGPLMFEPRVVFDSALVGTAQQCGGGLLACYSFERMVEAMVGNNRELSLDEVIEHIYMNMLDAFVGPLAPVVLFQ